MQNSNYAKKQFIPHTIKHNFKRFLKKTPITRKLMSLYFRSKLYRRILFKSINNEVKLFSKIKPIALFSKIDIETMNRCNGVCEFCPVNKNVDPRDYKKMDEKLLDKIINELASLNYNGEIALFSNNEPFLDNRMVGFIKKVRIALPNAHHYIYTNATTLTLEMFKEVINNLDMMFIDNYNNDLTFTPNVKIINDYCLENPDINEKVQFNMILTNAVRQTRGGQSPNNKTQKTYPVLCSLPYKQLIIRPDGKISLCCQDALGKHTLGDVNNNTLKEIWHSDKYEDIRRKLMAGRKNIELCEYCDFFR